MILADKLIGLRKRSGWSQEELAEKLNVSRQSVSKWESAQSTPDLGRVLALSELFGVSTDYLLKDDIEDAQYVDAAEESALKRVSMEEAHAFLTAKARAAREIALAVFMCAMSPVALLILGAASEAGMLSISEGAAGGIGLAALIALVAPAVGIFIHCGIQLNRFEYLETECVETEYGVSGMAREARRQYKPVYTKRLICAICLCIASVTPLFVAGGLTSDTFALVLALCATILIAGCGAAILVKTCVIWGGFDMLLQEGDYTRALKRGGRLRGAVSAAYWLIAAAVYIGYSLYGNAWDTSWIIWPVAALIYAAIISVMIAAQKRER